MEGERQGSQLVKNSHGTHDPGIGSSLGGWSAIRKLLVSLDSGIDQYRQLGCGKLTVLKFSCSSSAINNVGVWTKELHHQLDIWT